VHTSISFSFRMTAPDQAGMFFWRFAVEAQDSITRLQSRHKKSKKLHQKGGNLPKV
jgi:hypothetical protein